MAKVGLNLNLNIDKIDLERAYQGAKGNYISLTVFVDLDKEDQYGNNGSISQSLTREEREQGVQLPIVGNAKVFWKNLASGQSQPQQQGSWGQPQQQQGSWGQPQQPKQPQQQAPQQQAPQQPQQQEQWGEPPF